MPSDLNLPQTSPYREQLVPTCLHGALYTNRRHRSVIAIGTRARAGPSLRGIYWVVITCQKLGKLVNALSPGKRLIPHMEIHVTSTDATVIFCHPVYPKTRVIAPLLIDLCHSMGPSSSPYACQPIDRESRKEHQGHNSGMIVRPLEKSLGPMLNFAISKVIPCKICTVMAQPELEQYAHVSMIFSRWQSRECLTLLQSDQWCATELDYDKLATSQP
jgi:hypothetical protein